MNLKLLKKKLKSDKGVTGIDIVIASTIILVSVGVIISIYTNINNANKGVTRKSGATRVATQIVEKIDMYYYDQFVQELKDFASSLDVDYCSFIRDASTPALLENGTYTVKTINKDNIGSAQSFLGVKIPRGYTLNCVVKNNFGTNEVEGYDLVKSITVKVQFDVAGITKDVTLTTVKTREKVDKLNNLPKTEITTADLNNLNAGEEVKSYEFLKQSVNAAGNDVFTKVSPTDNSWYSYTNVGMKPAYVVVTTNTFTPEFNASSELDTSKSQTARHMFIWIPACEIDDSGSSKTIKYGYLSTDKEVIIKDVVRSNDSSIILKLLSVDANNPNATINNMLGNNKAGRWLCYSNYLSVYSKLNGVIN